MDASLKGHRDSAQGNRFYRYDRFHRFYRYYRDGPIRGAKLQVKGIGFPRFRKKIVFK